MTTDTLPRRGARGHGPRPNFTFRISPETKARLAKLAERDRRSLSEQAEHAVESYFQFEGTRDWLDRQKAEVAAQTSAAAINAIRLAGWLIIREAGYPRQVTLNYDAFIAEAQGVSNAFMQPGFVAPDWRQMETPPKLSADERERVEREIAELEVAELERRLAKAKAKIKSTKEDKQAMAEAADKSAA